MHLDLLDNVRVVECSAFIAAPLAGMLMAQFGADVIKVDMIGGPIDYARMPVMPSGRSLYWTGLNKAKRSVAVDLRRPEGRELIQALVTADGNQAGTFLTNTGSEWLSHAALAKRRSDLISCTIEGNGDGSTAVDYTVNCAAGLPAMTGWGSTSAPVNHVLPAWDIACANHAAFALVAAIARRQRTGSGAELRLALSDIAFSTVANLGMLAEAELLSRDRPAIGNYVYGAFGRDFATCDGGRLYVAAISLGQWRKLVEATQCASLMVDLQNTLELDFDKEAHRFVARESIAAVLEPWFSARSTQEASRELEAGRACWGRYQTVGDALRQDPRVNATNPVFSYIDTAGVGRHLATGSVVRETHGTALPSKPAPLLGEHTDEVLSQVLGMSSDHIGRLHDAKIVAGPDLDPTHHE
jgi:2-methylfumaryl-CoA isomerase